MPLIHCDVQRCAKDEQEAKLLALAAGKKMFGVHVETGLEFEQVRKARIGAFCEEVTPCPKPK